ncbi:unnamed protein product [Linum tenue]|uniref:Uncharacterized protein n=1 Tax=Linum tenue TaxID=586396 RepID=A0AAV0L6H7_9ROSI|nr:unnamed protein product [Linum tenue]
MGTLTLQSTFSGRKVTWLPSIWRMVWFLQRLMFLHLEFFFWR